MEEKFQPQQWIVGSEVPCLGEIQSRNNDPRRIQRSLFEIRRRFHGVQEKDLGGAIQIEKDCGASVLICFSPVLLFATPWTVTHQGPLSIEFSRQEQWSGLPFLSAGIFLTQGSNLGPIHCRQSLDYCPNHQGLQY